MKAGIFTNCFKDKTWEEVCIFSSEVGLRVLEVGAGALNGKSHCDPAEIMKDDLDVKKFVKTAEKYGVEIGSLSCMGNYVHPNKRIADDHTKDLEAVIEFASKIGVKVINGFAGCPGAAEDAIYPNWIGLAYPPEFAEYYKWQWEKRLIPYWREMAKKLRKHKIKFGFELHPGDAIYNASTFFRMKEAVGEEVGCCLDCTHLFWQQIDPIKLVKKIGSSIVNVHAQDSAINREVADLDGVLDPKRYEDHVNRAWNFKVVGYGHGEEFWKNLVTALRLVGYDGPLSVEQQDPMMSLKEGFIKASEFLNRVIYHEPAGTITY
ncbi:MAG: sugar phosphate isomerase/epimerase [Cyanobacteria bacterium]|nr:sugar phosphate isomerase/epimerase [Cyanobacteriota bacterium]